MKAHIKEQFKVFQNMVENNGKEKGKRGKKRNYVTEEDVNREAQKRLEDFLEQRGPGSQGVPSTSGACCAVPSELLTEDRSTASQCQASPKVTATPKKIYLKKIELQLNGQKMDQLEDSLTEDECIQSFWRLSTFNGQMNSLFANSISYNDFRENAFMLTYDLSTSGKCGTNYVVPTIRQNFVFLD
jgi:hypothetical protein